jgi:hypothetical protein
MLLRLQNAFGSDDQVQPVVFSAGSRSGDAAWGQPSETINLVVGYSGSPNSLTALDLTLCMAHQTRLATQRQVMVHVVYAIQGKQFEQADRILHQARYLAQEWRGCLTTHLEFGETAAGLKQVVLSEKADLLLVGCRSQKHPLVQQLSKMLPCPLLGLPQRLNAAAPVGAPL